MKLLEAMAKLLALKQDVLQTSDVAAALQISSAHASQVLRRLSKAGFFIPLARAKWACRAELDPLLLPEYLTAPAPSYISFQSALYYHGMISQIPHTVYAASLARTRQYKTRLAHISIHHIQPDFFFGFETVPNSKIKMASPEKALLDFFYLSFVRSSLFSKLPELELPQNFKTKKAFKMIDQIGSARIRTFMRQKLKKCVS